MLQGLLGQRDARIDLLESGVPLPGLTIRGGDEREHDVGDVRSNDRSMLLQRGKHLGQAALDVAVHRAGGTGKHTAHGAKIGDRVVGGYLRRARGVTGRRVRVAADRLENRRMDEGGGEAMRPPALLGVRDAIPGPSVGLIEVAEKPEGEAAHAVGRDHRVDTVCLVAEPPWVVG